MNKLVISSIVFGAVTVASVLGASQTHATTQSCVDATVKSNLVASMTSHDTVSVGTKNNAPVCKDVTLFFDSYTMPADYNGKAFTGNATASPQTKFDGTTVTLKAGSTTPVSATIKVPTCDNYQTDLYNGTSEITTVTAAGHGSAWITGEINGHAPVKADGSLDQNMTLTKDASCDVTPGQGGGTPTTTTTTTTELPSTGTSENLTVAFASILAAGAYGVTRFIASKRA